MQAADPTFASMLLQNAGALFALAGVVVTASLGGFWQWLQHQRERALRDEQWNRDDVLRRRAARESAYEALSATAYKLLLVCAREEHTAGGPRHTPAVADLYDALAVTLARVRLSGSPETVDAADVLVVACGLVMRATFQPFDALDSPVDTAWRDQVSGEAADALAAFVDAARVDLDVGPRHRPTTQLTTGST